MLFDSRMLKVLPDDLLVSIDQQLIAMLTAAVHSQKVSRPQTVTPETSEVQRHERATVDV